MYVIYVIEKKLRKGERDHSGFSMQMERKKASWKRGDWVRDLFGNLRKG